MIEFLSKWFATVMLTIPLLIQIFILCFLIYLVALVVKFLKKAIRYFDKKIEFLDMQINSEKNNTENTDKE